MSQSRGNQYLFDVLKPHEDEEGPWYVFFERTPTDGEADFIDTPLYIKLPPEGVFWTKTLYPDDEVHGSHPTALFERNLATIMDDPSWRMAVQGNANASPTLQTEISQQFFDELPAHEAHLLREIQRGVTNGSSLPEGLQSYLLDLA